MATRESVVRFKAKNPSKLVKWKIHVGSRLSYGTVLFLFEQLHSEETKDRPRQYQKFKSNVEGTVKCLIAEEDSTVTPGCELLELQACMHQVVMKDMCAECGADLRRLDSDNLAKVVAATSVSMIHSVPELRVSHEQAQLLGQADEERLLKNRKLVLLVDLDQTLIHTTNENIAPNMKDVHHFQLYGPHSPWYHTKIRPRTSDFLKNISQLYELHICTFGARAYAHHIASLLDHDGKYFSHRILSRDECFNTTSKTGNLKALFPCGDSLVCIIDDREDVWNFSPNLIPVKPYHFFSQTGDINAPFGMEKSVQRQEYQPEVETAFKEKCDIIRRKGFLNIRDIFESDDGKIEPITPVVSEGEDEKQDPCHQKKNDSAKMEQSDKSTIVDSVTLKDKLAQCRVEDKEAVKMEGSQTVEVNVPSGEEDMIVENKDAVEEINSLKEKVVNAEAEKIEESHTVDVCVPIKEDMTVENKDAPAEEMKCSKEKIVNVEVEKMEERHVLEGCIPNREEVMIENNDAADEEMNSLEDKVVNAEAEKMEETCPVGICVPNREENTIGETKVVAREEMRCLKEKVVNAEVEIVKMEESHSLQDSVPNKEKYIKLENEVLKVKEIKCLKTKLAIVESEKMEERQTVEDSVSKDTIRENKEVIVEEIKCLKHKVVNAESEIEKMEESHSLHDSVPSKEKDVPIIIENNEVHVEEMKCFKDKVVNAKSERKKMEESYSLQDSVLNKEKDIIVENNEVDEMKSLNERVVNEESRKMKENHKGIIIENKDIVEEMKCSGSKVVQCQIENAEAEKMEVGETLKGDVCTKMNVVAKNKNEINSLKVRVEDVKAINFEEKQIGKNQDAELEVNRSSKTPEVNQKETQSESISLKSNGVEECNEKMLDECNFNKSSKKIEPVKVSKQAEEGDKMEIPAEGEKTKAVTLVEGEETKTCKMEQEVSGDGFSNSVSEIVDDSDDYLYYLEEILTMIHQAFYDMYDQMKAQKRNEIPDLKTVIPYVQRKVLKGTSMVLSGLIPTNAEVEKSKLWVLAKSLGAVVTKDLTTKPGQSTTHVVAAKLGTAKVNKARRMKGIHIVNPDWLYCCSERWEHVDERLFPLRDGIVYKKHPYRNPSLENQMQRYLKQMSMPGQQNDPAASGEPCPVYDPVTGKRIRQQHQVITGTNHKSPRTSSSTGKRPGAKKVEERFSESFSPLLSFSSAEIEQMGQEVDDACSEDSNADNSDSDSEKNSKPKNSGSESSTEESLSGGECPKGWKKRKRGAQDGDKDEFGGVIYCEDDVPQTKCKRREFPTDSENSNINNSEEDGESIGSVDEEMAAAVEREFLSC